MNAKKVKLLRKIAKLSGRTDNYIKNQYKRMEPDQQVAYIAFVKENLRRLNEITSSTSLDAPKEAIL